MAKPLLDDDLWELLKPLLPPPKPRRARFPGRKPLEPRKVLTGILVVLKTGIPWEALPQDLGWGSGMTCWRYLRTWHRAGVWPQLHVVLLATRRGADTLDGSRAVVDSASVRAVLGGPNGPASDRSTAVGEQASRHHRGAGDSARGHPDRGECP